MDRRKFLRIGGSLFLAAIAGGAYSFFVEPKKIQLTRLRIKIKHLPAPFIGFRILQIADTHHGFYTGVDFLKKTVQLANAQNPDLIVLTGDYVFGRSDYIKPGIRPFGELSAPEGVFAVLGNHDHWQNAAQTRVTLQRVGVRELTNRSVILEKYGERLCLAGVGDLWEDDPDLEEALQGVDSEVPKILLSHNPDYAEQMPVRPRIDFMISGHTHGGQVNLPLIGAPLVPSAYGQKYRAGLVRGPRCPVYISRGLGVISPPARFNCPPELPLFTLEAV